MRKIDEYMLADAVQTINELGGFKRMLAAISSLAMPDEEAQTLLMTFLANIPHRRGFSPVHQQNLASSICRLLEKESGFDAEEFTARALS